MDRSTDTSHAPRGLFVTGRGFILPAAIWAFYFALVYSVQGVGCAAPLGSGAPEGAGPLWGILLAITLITAAALAVTGFWSWRAWRRIEPEADRDVAFERSTFLSLGALLNSVLFLVATLWIGLPALLFDPCRGHGVW